MIYFIHYRVSVFDTFHIKYHQGKHSMIIEIDLRDTIPALYRRAIKQWNPPYDKEPVTEIIRDQIIKNIQFYFKYIFGKVVEVLE